MEKRKCLILFTTVAIATVLIIVTIIVASEEGKIDFRIIIVNTSEEKQYVGMF